MRSLAFGALLFTLACAAQPPVRDRTLELSLPDAFGGASGSDSQALERIDPLWWHEFVQPELRVLVEEALLRNPDVAAVAARLEAAGALLEIAGADGVPSVDLDLTRSRVKRNFIGFPTGGGADDVTTRSTTYELGLNTSWEVDLFGRVQAQVDAAHADQQAAAADLAGAQLALIGSVLKGAYAAMEAEQQRVLSEENLTAWVRNEAVLEQRYRAGLRSAFDARRVASQRATAASNLAVRERFAREALRRVERLLGRPSTGSLVLPAELPALPASIPSGLPVELIARRPDLAAAERRLLASEKRVAGDRAALYPRLTLTGGIGTSSSDLDDLLDGDFGVWDFGTQLVLPLFEGGRLRAQVVASESAANEALLNFTSALLVALGEVEAALDLASSLSGELELRHSAARDASRARDLANDRYRRGLGDLLELLDAQRTALVDAATHVRVRRELLDARVDVHLTLGGGFDATQLTVEDDS